MNTTTIRYLVVAAGLLATIGITSNANAQCCGAPTTAYYQPAAYTAYSPVAYTGWYPGYFLDRIRARMWGAPSTYVAAYPSTYVASYPTYTAGYAVGAPISTCSSCATYSASYAPCTTCAATQQVTLRPVCSTCCDPCSSCSTCSSGVGHGVTQTSYQEPGGCGCNGQSGSATFATPSETVLVPGSQQAPPYSGGPQPQLPPNYESVPRSTEKPLSNGNGLEPVPAEANGSPTEATPEDSSGGSGAYLEAPQLFSPTDRAARREIKSVQLALYDQPVGHQRVSARSTSITAQQAERDAAGWQSASK
jgi:hypothetical protein